MDYDDVEILVALLRMKKDVISTTELAPVLSLSQQSVSRRIREIEEKGLIRREIVPDGQRIIVTEMGFSLVREAFLDIKEALGDADDKRGFSAHLVSGLGEGAYYLAQDGYFSQVADQLGFRPYLGTLNLEIRDDGELLKKDELFRSEPIVIEGFSDSGRTFGELLAFRCMLAGVECAIIAPKRTHHDSRTVEIIAPVKLRDALKISDGDKVEVVPY